MKIPKGALAVIAGTMIGIPIFAQAIPVFAQSPASRPSFEVASIKENTSGARNSGTSTRDGGLFIGTNVSVKQLIMQSYRLQDFQVLGGPDWVNTAAFDIQARAAEGAVPKSTEPFDINKPDTLALMVQSLLEERFQLKVRHEAREMSVYILSVGKDGAKLKAPAAETGSTNTNVSNGKTHVVGKGSPVGTLAQIIGRQLRRPVIDKTNLTGPFDFELDWVNPNAPTDEVGPSVFTALQEQVGLKLESAKAPVEVLMIESIQKPSEN
jgi:bla regulator protein blaR1